MITKHEESMLVFTYKDQNSLLKFNGSQSWVLNPERARKCKFVICVNNATNPLSQNLNINNHYSGFLVGRICNVSRAIGTKLNNRWIIEFDEYAEIDIQHMWKGWRNPVIYKKTQEVDIDFDSLDWRKVPLRDDEFIRHHIAMENRFFGETGDVLNVENTQEEKSSTPMTLSIEEAKIGLSNKYDVPIENIEIILKG